MNETTLERLARVVVMDTLETRTRFAWWPVWIWARAKPWLTIEGREVQPKIWVCRVRLAWLRRVVEVKTMEGWTAYEWNQPDGRQLSEDNT